MLSPVGEGGHQARSHLATCPDAMAMVQSLGDG